MGVWLCLGQNFISAVLGLTSGRRGSVEDLPERIYAPVKTGLYDACINWSLTNFTSIYTQNMNVNFTVAVWIKFKNSIFQGDI